MQKGNIKEKCPNCVELNPEIEKMEDGSCGVCGGSGFITWQETGIKIRHNPATSSSKQELEKTSEIVEELFRQYLQLETRLASIGGDYPHPIDQLVSLINDARESGKQEERERIKNAWNKLNIVGASAAGSSQGLLVRNPWGEQDSMQVDRDSFKNFIKSLKDKT